MDKKQQEKLILEKFIQLLTDFPKGKITISESPDFLLHISRKKTIGIEITSIPNIFSFEELHHIIEKKEGKTDLYQKLKLYRIWLIIDCQQISVHDRNRTENFQFKSSFDEIFILDRSKAKVIKLNSQKG